MAQLRELKGRIKATANIKRITKTMQMIATAKFQASVRRATETKPYTEKVARSWSANWPRPRRRRRRRHRSPAAAPPPKPPTNRELVLILTSNRGLCGAYNANVLRTCCDHVHQSRQTTAIDVQVVGKKGIAFCQVQ
jgi:F-type H+-transporting ATPase subunit gamma